MLWISINLDPKNVTLGHVQNVLTALLSELYFWHGCSDGWLGDLSILMASAKEPQLIVLALR